MVGTAVGGVIGGVEGVLGIRPASYSQDTDVPPPRAYKQRKAKRAKAKQARRTPQSPAAGLCELTQRASP